MQRDGDRRRVPVEVQLLDEVSPRLLWRGPVWKVRAVLAHWIASGVAWAPVGCQG